MSDESEAAEQLHDRFDEAFYVRTNPDVAEAIRNGVHASGWEHFLSHGRGEGRRGTAGDLVISGCGILNIKPLVLHAWWWQESPFSAIEAISQRLANTPFVMLVSNAWSLLARYRDGPEFMDLVRAYRSHKSRFAHHTIIFLANDALERGMFQWQGVESVVFQHNGFYNLDRMPWVSRRAREFDAVYMARIHSYKRFELMAQIEKGCVLFSDVERDYFRDIEGRVKHLTFVNGDPRSDTIALLTPAEVAEWFARCRCGLCLSDEEGAMLTSMEYLLCGLPVVSTPSIGGRDEYFDDRYCLICDETPAAVAEAVRKMTARDIDPAYVRASTLSRIMKNRAGLLQSLTDRIALRDGSLDELSRGMLDVAHRYDFTRSRTVLSLLAGIRAAGGEVP